MEETCEHCHSYGSLKRRGDGSMTCSHCGQRSEKYSVARTDISFNRIEVHFSPMYDDYNAAGEHLHTRGILGMLSIDCDAMPEDLRTAVEAWVRERMAVVGRTR